MNSLGKSLLGQKVSFSHCIFIAATELYKYKVIWIYIILLSNKKDRRPWSNTVLGLFVSSFAEDRGPGTDGPKKTTKHPPLNSYSLSSTFVKRKWQYIFHVYSTENDPFKLVIDIFGNWHISTGVSIITVSIFSMLMISRKYLLKM